MAAVRAALLIAGTVWLLSLTQTIVIPVVTAAILASVLAPLVRRLKRHGVPRGLGAALVLLLIVVAGAWRWRWPCSSSWPTGRCSS